MFHKILLLIHRYLEIYHIACFLENRINNFGLNLPQKVLLYLQRVLEYWYDWENLALAGSFTKKRLQRRCFPANVVKFLRAPILQNICERLLLTFEYYLEQTCYFPLFHYYSNISTCKCLIFWYFHFKRQQKPWQFKKLIVEAHFSWVFSGWNYGRSSVMTDQISNFTEQSFSEIRRNVRSLDETIWTPTCNKLHVFDTVEEMKRKKVFIEYYIYLSWEGRGNQSSLLK